MGKYNVRTLPIAEQDIDAAVDYLMQEDPNAALSFLDGLAQAEQQLSEFPESGALVQEVEYAKKGYRFMLVTGYYVFYTFRDEIIWIARVLHVRRNYVKLL